MRYLRGNEILPPAVMDMVQAVLERYDPDFGGATVYIPSRNGANIRSKGRDEQVQARALAVVAVHDGYTRQEAAAMAGVSITTISTWVTRFGGPVADALREIRGESDG